MDARTETIESEPEGYTREKLIRDLKTLARDAEELVKATAGDLGEKMGDRAKEARERLTASLDHAKGTYHQLEKEASARVEATDRVIRQHPYQTVGAAFGIGLLIGVLVNRK